MLIRLLILLARMLAVVPSTAQPGPFIAADLHYAVNVCSDTVFTPPVIFPEVGDISDLGTNNRGCLNSGERNGIWITFNTAAAGRVAFSITAGLADDFDFAIWGPFYVRPDTLIIEPTRCSYSAVAGSTGTNFDALDVSEVAGGDSWVKALDVAPEQIYVMYVTNFSVTGATFDLTWQFQDGAALECLELPAVDFWQNATTIFAGGTVSFADLSLDYPFAWWWQFDGGTPATSLEDAPQNIAYELSGCYDVRLTAYNAAGDNALVETCQVYVETTTGLPQNILHGFNITQVDGTLRIVPVRAGSYSMRMVDATGRLLRNRSAQGQLELSLMDLPAGVYSVVVDHGSGRSVQRIVLGQ